MKKQLLLFVLVLLPIVASADAVEIDGIYYNLVTKANQAEVTSHPNRYTGNVVIPETVSYEGVEYRVTSIAPYAFSSCSGLTSITIPNSVTSIGDGAFHSCSSLTSITIPNSIARIEGFVFDGCSSLTSVSIPNNVTTIDGYAFYNCSSLTSITIPNSVTTIDGAETFSRCSSLTSITIPNGVTHIGGGTFSDCSSLVSVTIGTGMKSITSGAFARCPELKDVYCLAEKVPNTSSDVFEGSHIEYATLHIPDGSVSLYSNAEPWKNFKNIVGLNGGGEAQKCATPTISYGGKKLTFACETEGVEYVSEIKDADVKNYNSSTIDLTATYEISVYATKTGYTNSNVATATLVWTSGSFTETTPATNISNAPLNDVPVLIQSNQGVLTIQGANDGTQVSVHGMDGTQIGSATIQNGQACIATYLQSGSAAIVKVGQKAVKMIVK